MARESQGLQIALIIFVMLTIVLAVTTFLFHSRYTEALKSAKDDQDRATQAMTKASNKDAECADLKRMIGMSDKSLADIREQFDKDMKAYGSNYPEDARFYNTMLNRLAEAFDDRSKEVKTLKDKLADLDNRFAIREASKDKQIEQFKGAVDSAASDLNKLTTDYTERRTKVEEDQKTLMLKLDGVRKASTSAIEQATAKEKEAEAVARDQIKVIHQQGTMISKLNQPTMDVPAGEVTWVNQGSSTVWINLGRADALERQTGFSVYSADSTDLGKAVKKATIEVTKILGDHSAEARIVDNKLTDPIMPGDKIHTPLWTPGEQIHFALAGFMDLDGDGRNAMSTVHNLITMNGGVVDCQLDDRGKRTGEMDARTRYLVLGDEPTARGQQELIQAYSRMVADADRLNVKKMTLNELKQKMGYKKTGAVERMDGGSAPTPSATRSGPPVKAGPVTVRRRPAAAAADADQ